MIPKRIHYCWFGKGEQPELVKKCIASWRKNLPDYEIIEWNEENFDLNKNQFVKEAYKAKKYAFVSDYVRLYALFNYGGIYLDSDVEVIKTLDSFLKHKAFTGGESPDTCVTGTIGAIKGHRWIKKNLDYYNNKSFFDKDAQIPNTQIITNITKEMYGFDNSLNIKNYKDELYVYPFEYFCAKDYKTGKVYLSNNTYTIHHFNGSWLTKSQKFQIKAINFVKKIIKYD